MQRIYECNDDGLWRARDDDDDYAFFFFFSSSLSLFFMIRRIALIGRDKRKKTEEGRRNEFVRGERERERERDRCTRAGGDWRRCSKLKCLNELSTATK